MKAPLPIVVLISGNGSNLQAIIDAIQHQKLNLKIKAVISNRADAYGLVRARRANILTHVLTPHDCPIGTTFEHTLLKLIEEHSPQLVVLAGFMKKLGPMIVQRFMGKMINIHPSLLPKHPGLHTHQQVLEAKDQQHGATVHFVTEIVDAGPIIDQMALTVEPTDTVESLQQRVQELEHKLYPKVLALFAKERIHLKEHHVCIDGKLMKKKEL